MTDDTEYLTYLRNRERLAATLRLRVAEAIGTVREAEKALAADADMDDSGFEGDADIGPDADDADDELQAAARHLRNVLRIAIGHERDIRDEITAAAGEDENR
jgi:hypothetical protein